MLIAKKISENTLPVTYPLTDININIIINSQMKCQSKIFFLFVNPATKL